MQQTTSTYRKDPRSGPTVAALWPTCLIVFSLLYLATCQRGVSWQDSGMFQWRVEASDYEGDLGLALSHPLYIAVAQLLKLIPIGIAAGRLNFFSGLGMAVALANLACIVAILTGRRWIGAVSAAMLSVAHTPWWLATTAEVYTWSVAGLTAELWLLVSLIRRPRPATLAALALVSGLGLCIHNFALLSLPVHLVVTTALILRRRLPVWSLVSAAGAYILGAGVYIAMTVNLAVRTGDLGGAINSAIFGGTYSRHVLNVTGLSKYFKANAALAAMNFVSFLAPLAVVGWARMRRKIGGAVTSAVAGITVIEILFVARYSVPDQFTFLLPSLVMIALAAGVGISVMADASRPLRNLAIAGCLLSIVMPPVFYSVAPSLAGWTKLTPRHERELPFRDELRYWLVPWKHNERSAELFARAALTEAGPDGVIMCDTTVMYPLLLAQARDGQWPDVSVQYRGRPLPSYGADPQAFRKALAGRKLYAVSPATGDLPPELLADVQLSRAEGAVLFLARWKRH